jgi:hypothetical protein
MVWANGTSRRFRHRETPDAFFYPARQLEQQFGRGGFEAINEPAGLVLVDEHYNPFKSTTKAYTLTDKARTLVAECIGQRRQPTGLISDTGRQVRTRNLSPRGVHQRVLKIIFGTPVRGRFITVTTDRAKVNTNVSASLAFSALTARAVSTICFRRFRFLHPNTQRRKPRRLRIDLRAECVGPRSPWWQVVATSEATPDPEFARSIGLTWRRRATALCAALAGALPDQTGNSVAH